MNPEIKAKLIEKGYNFNDFSVDEFWTSNGVQGFLNILKGIILNPATSNKEFVAYASLYLLIDSMTRIMQ